MARVTVEDCVQKVPNRFDLVMVATQRARELGGGAQITIERDNDKNPVVALREIAESTVAVDALRNEMIKGHQRLVPTEDRDEDVIELMHGEQGWVQPLVGEGEGLDQITEGDVDALDAQMESDEASDSELDEDDVEFPLDGDKLDPLGDDMPE